MPLTVTMPRLDKDMEEGKIALWHKQEGDAVEKGDVLFEIETDKAAVEVEAEATGILGHVVAEEMSLVPVDHPVAWIYAEGEKIGARPVATMDKPAQAEPEVDTAKPPPTAQSAQPAQEGQARRFATPAALEALEDVGLKLQDIKGTGPGNRVQKSDVLMAARLGALGGDNAAPRAPAETHEPAPLHPSDESGPLMVTSAGKDKQLPMVMIHGFLADATGWEKLARPLEAHRRVHRIELPCHGRSPRRRITGFAELAAELRHAFDAIDLERCHLVGHSLGGALALALADIRPRKVASLTLISPAGLGPEFNGDAIRGLCRATRSESIGPWLKLLTADPDAIGFSYIQAVAAARNDAELRAAQLAMGDQLFPDGVQGFDLNAALQRLTAPTRIIWGRQDAIIPWRHALRAPGHVSLNLFEDAGHMPHYEIPEKIEPLLRALP
ncbi:acetoin dehydrogenase dihydrolipoyllysine-residue acetyltransferase subunit [Sulfitobacter aestuarii]|uniref:Acetoin dehydrogenase dihydrolipoyllysine-residue acetyltransferase subunit n=1 Tax=Sulfitobacter aestuarii TaxID=2161676 RepID=A0ABW5U6R5_9RHOB